MKIHALNLKSLFTFLLVSMGLISYAQNVINTKSAEYCIAYIDQLAKTAVSHNDGWKHTAKFDGTSFTKAQTTAYNIFNEESTDIDWTTFESIDVGTPDKEKILVMINFTDDFPTKRTTVEIKDGGIKNKEFTTSGYFLSIFPFPKNPKLKTWKL